MAGLRMTGLISGMDTESMVNELVKANSAKVDKIKKNKQLVEWKKEAWQGLNTKLYNFFKGELSIFHTNSTYQKKKAVSNDETKVSVTAGANSANGTHRVSVKQLASSAYLTGGNIKANGQSYHTYAGVSASTDFADMTDKAGNSLDLVGKKLTIGNGNDAGNLEIVLGEDGINNLDALNKKLSETKGFEGLKASYTDGSITFTNKSAAKDDDGNETGVTFTVESADLGISGEVNFKEDKGSGTKTTLSGTTAMYYKKEFTSSDISSSTKLEDIGIKVGTTFSLRGQDFVVAEGNTIKDFTEALSKMGVSASFDAGQGRFYINASDTGSDNDFTLTSSDADALEILGLGSTSTKIDAQDAIIDYNGVEYRGASNTFNLNGLTITAKAVTGTYDKVTGEFTDDTPINISISTDTDGIYQSIKDFVKKYNELIDEMNKLYDEKKSDYEPLTEEEKKELSESEVTKWEEKAKQGVLRRDSTINTLLFNMRNILNQGIEVDNGDGTTTRYSLASLGIVTGDYSENGKLHILGDEDDETYSQEENKLKQMLESKPEIFASVLAGNKEKPGIGYQLYDSLSKSMKRVDGVSSSLTFYNDVTMDKELDDYDDEIEKWQKKLQDMEDKYYDQFAAMESAMAKLQSQQSYLASLMGGGA